MSTAPSIPHSFDESAVDYGEVFTQRWVVDLILDLVGYTSDRDLVDTVAYEPSCGSGAFLTAMTERLIRSTQLHGRDLADASTSIVASDLLAEHVEVSRAKVVDQLQEAGAPEPVARGLADQWVTQRDFLLEPPPAQSADFVVGNPPYIRLEAIPIERNQAYRAACQTMGGRADIYVGFYEHGLRALKPRGALGFICADRWMRNAYGARLRSLVTQDYAVTEIVEMTGVDAFETEVDAYPAITVLRAEPQIAGPLVVETDSTFNGDDAAVIPSLMAQTPASPPVIEQRFRAAKMPTWPTGSAGWPSGSPTVVAAVSRLEADFAPLQNDETETTVGIGVATGADRVFVTKDPDIVERDRLLPLALPADIASGKVEWAGSYLVNPWQRDGLIELERFPLLQRYFEQHTEVLSKRHTAKRGNWFRTIDRVAPGLAETPKLYLPDFKERMFPVLDEGITYPHHNLYWVTSKVWDLRVLGGLLLSDIANLFIRTYSVRMRGGFYRYQAQYLRRIRLPDPASIDAGSADRLRNAFDTHDVAAATSAALPLYGLDELPT